MSGFLGILLGIGAGSVSGTVTVAANIPGAGDVGYSNGLGGGSTGGSISTSNFNSNTIAQIEADGSGGQIFMRTPGGTAPPQNVFTTAVINGKTVTSASATYSNNAGAYGSWRWSGVGGQFFTTAGTYNFKIS